MMQRAGEDASGRQASPVIVCVDAGRSRTNSASGPRIPYMNLLLTPMHRYDILSHSAFKL